MKTYTINISCDGVFYFRIAGIEELAKAKRIKQVLEHTYSGKQWKAELYLHVPAYTQLIND